MGDDKDREVLVSLMRACLSSSSGNGAQPHTPQYLLATLMPSPGELQSGICVGAGSSTVMPPCSREYNKRNCCFRTTVLEETFESPLDSKIKPVDPKGNQS